MFADLTCGALSELESGRSWSSREIAMRVAAGAAGLRAHGLQRGDRLFIFWSATNLVGGKQTTWHGVDRFRIENGMAVEEQVIFDTAVLSAG